MYSLHLVCAPSEVEDLSFQLWELGSVGIREEDIGDKTRLIATFENETIDQNALLLNFRSFSPLWQAEDNVDWIAATHNAWPSREIGARLFLAPVWSTQPAPPGRYRLIHNPGQASGTGEHPCTQLALESLERLVGLGSRVVDVGTGSGILAIAARLLGAQSAIGLDTDADSLQTAKENFALNKLEPSLMAGSADCISDHAADLVIANISGTVLLNLADDLMRIRRPHGQLILTGFPESELAALTQVYGAGHVTSINEWRCLALGF